MATTKTANAGPTQNRTAVSGRDEHEVRREAVKSGSSKDSMKQAVPTADRARKKVQRASAKR